MEGAALLGAAGRWIGFVSLLLAVGAVVFRFGVLRATGGLGGPSAGLAAQRAAMLGAAAALGVAVGAALRLYTQVAGFVDPGEPLERELLHLILTGTTWGRGWLTQVAAALVATAGFAVARLAPGPGWIMAAVGASALALSAPLTGHATGERAGSWGYPLEVLHVLGAGAWLGTLTAVVFAGLPAARSLGPDASDRRIAGVVGAFSPIALTGAGTAVAAGLALAFRYLEGSISALWASGYGRTLSLKLMVLAGVMALGAWNWRVARPRLGSADASARIRRSSLAELALGTILLAVTAVLVSRPMPGEE